VESEYADRFIACQEIRGEAASCIPSSADHRFVSPTTSYNIKCILLHYI
jgi:hypothetical protein